MSEREIFRLLKERDPELKKLSLSDWEYEPESPFIVEIFPSVSDKAVADSKVEAEFYCEAYVENSFAADAKASFLLHR